MTITLSALVLLGSSLSAMAQSPGSFVATGKMTTPRVGHTATMLKDGRILITGGRYEDVRGKVTFLATAELYDPATGTFTPTGDMTIPRQWHTATLLPDARVLIVGGLSGSGFPNGSSSSELYDPATGLFTRSGDMTAPHYFNAATLLSNGNVLIIGSPTYEFYDPATGVFKLAGPSHDYLGTVLLPDDKLLIAGFGDVSLYDAKQDSLKLLTNWRGANFDYQNATLLGNGKVLVTGGGYSDVATNPETLLFDPRRGTVDHSGLLLISRETHTATLLPGGHVLIAGGYSEDGYPNGIPAVAAAEDYDPSTGEFTYAGDDPWLRSGHTATLLPDGSVLIVGGTSDTAAAEFYVPPLRPASAASLTGPLTPESLASLFGSRLALTTESADPQSPPTSLGGISLRLTDSSGVATLAPLLYVSPSQINFEVPAGIATGKVTVEVVNAPTQLSVAAQVDPVAPGLFTYDDNTVIAYGLRFEPNGKQTVLSIRNTISLDDRPVYLVLYATGIRNRSSVANIQCTIGGISVPVEYAGPEGSAIPGLDQVNVHLPAVLKGLGVASLALSVDGISSNTVSVDIR